MFKIYGDCINSFFYGTGTIGIVLFGILTFRNSMNTLSLKRFLIKLTLRIFPNYLDYVNFDNFI